MGKLNNFEGYVEHFMHTPLRFDGSIFYIIWQGLPRVWKRSNSSYGGKG